MQVNLPSRATTLYKTLWWDFKEKGCTAEKKRKEKKRKEKKRKEKKRKEKNRKEKKRKEKKRKEKKRKELLFGKEKKRKEKKRKEKKRKEKKRKEKKRKDYAIRHTYIEKLELYPSFPMAVGPSWVMQLWVGRGGLTLAPTCCHVGFSCVCLTLSISSTSFKISPSFNDVVQACDCMHVKLPQHT